MHGEPAKCTHGEQVRDFMHVEDVAAAFVALLDSKVRGIVNIASGEPLRLKDMIREIADQIGRRELVLLGAIQPSSADPPMLVADITRLHDEVGFRPVYNLNSGIMQTIEHLKISEIP
jgi:nucleoside-diphosphate-sugar epimerase